MAARATTPPVREATTDYGAGFLPVLFRSLIHPLVIHHALASDWEITNGTAIGSLDLALQSLPTITQDRDILSNEGKDAVAAWATQLTVLRRALDGAVADQPLSPEYRQQIQGVFPHGFALLAVLDSELLGVDTDGGRAP